MDSLTRLEGRLPREAARTARLLLRQKASLVLAESCTGGLIASSLVSTPGISRALAGSFVVYQVNSKQAWLGLPARLFKSTPDGASAEISEALAKAALRKTPHAQWAGAITGRLGPNPHLSPETPDGEAWVTIQKRGSKPVTQRVQLFMQESSLGARKAARAGLELRRKRQVLASIQFLRMVRLLLTRQPQSRQTP